MYTDKCFKYWIHVDLMQPCIFFERHAIVYLNWIGKVEGKMLGLIWMPTLVLQLISVPKHDQAGIYTFTLISLN